MLEGLIDSLGLPLFVLIVVGVSLLIVVILLMSYFKVLISITDFTFPNAKLRAMGNPFVKEEVLRPLMDSGNLNEIYSKIREENYALPKEDTEDIYAVERKLEEEVIGSIKKVYMSVPTNVKPFITTWMMKYDIKMVKRAMKGISSEREISTKNLLPVRIVDEEGLEEMKSARNLQELTTILKDTELGDALKGKEKVESFFEMDIELDRYLYENIRREVNKIESEERATVRYFFGTYSDILNLKIVFRGLREGIERDTLKRSLLPPGRELEEWKIENMVESTSMDEAFIELEGTSYDDLRGAKSSSSDFDIEKNLDKKLLRLVCEIYSQNILTIGPLLKYLVAKEMELRNLKILVRGTKEGMGPKKMEELMIMEDPI